MLFWLVLTTPHLVHLVGKIWVVPLPSNSHHQDYSIFSRESQPKPSFLTSHWEGGTIEGC